MLLTDDYFIKNIGAINVLTLQRKRRMENIITFSSCMKSSIETFPWCSFKHITNNDQNICDGCGKRGIETQCELSGQAYDANTIQPKQLDDQIAFEKVIFTQIINRIILKILRRIKSYYVVDLSYFYFFFKFSRSFYFAIHAECNVSCFIKFHIKSI